MDIIGPINPPSIRGHRYILTATDYFSKWAEAVALAEVRTSMVLDFLRTHINHVGLGFRKGSCMITLVLRSSLLPVLLQIQDRSFCFHCIQRRP